MARRWTSASDSYVRRSAGSRRQRSGRDRRARVRREMRRPSGLRLRQPDEDSEHGSSLRWRSSRARRLPRSPAFSPRARPRSRSSRRASRCSSRRAARVTSIRRTAAARPIALARQRTPEAILDAITTGTMKDNAARLTDAQKRILAEQLTGKPLGVSQARAGIGDEESCSAKPFGESPRAVRRGAAGASDSRQLAISDRPRRGLTADRVPKLALKWAFAFPNGSSGLRPAGRRGRPRVRRLRQRLRLCDRRGDRLRRTGRSRRRRASGRRSASAGRPGPRAAVYFGDLKGNVYARRRGHRARSPGRSAPTRIRFARITGRADARRRPALRAAVASLEEGAGANPNYECCTFRGGSSRTTR